MASYEIPNAPQLSNINDFRATIARGRDFSKAARFAVQIGRISNLFSELIYMCETAEMPGRALVLNDYRYYGPNFKMPHQSEYTEINFSFYVSDIMREKELFDNWLSYINPKNSYNFRFRNEYSTDVNIYQYSEIGESYITGRGAEGRLEMKSVSTYRATLRQAYPINVQPLALSWAEDNIHRLQVTFAYTDWVTLPESKETSDSPSRITPFSI